MQPLAVRRRAGHLNCVNSTRGGCARVQARQWWEVMWPRLRLEFITAVARLWRRERERKTNGVRLVDGSARTTIRRDAQPLPQLSGLSGLSLEPAARTSPLAGRKSSRVALPPATTPSCPTPQINSRIYGRRSADSIWCPASFWATRTRSSRATRPLFCDQTLIACKGR